MKSNVLTCRVLSLGACLGAFQVMAQENLEAPPRNIDIRPLAANCGVGPFEQIAKAGVYNRYCDVLTDAEKCLALIKAHMTLEGGLRDVSVSYQPRVAYCLETFRAGLSRDQE